MRCEPCNLVFGGDLDRCPSCGGELATETAPSKEAVEIAEMGFEPTLIPVVESRPQPGSTTPRSRALAPSPEDSSERYELVRELGRGGLGVVFLARDRRMFGREVALKRIRHDELRDRFGSGATRQDLVNLFLGEAEAMTRVHHSNVVFLYDSGVDAEGVFLVMEYVEGGTLRTRVETRGSYAPAEVARLGAQLCDALSEIHRRGMVHRDVKPENVLLTRKGTPKLADFGLVLTAAERGAGAKGTTMGTWKYMSPEQRNDAQRLTAAADIYSLAATLFFALAGANPGEPDLDGVPEPLRSALTRALEDRPEDRYPEADAFGQALEDASARLAKPATNATHPPGYPCYECDRPVETTSVYCSSCGADLLERRRAREKGFDDTCARAEQLVTSARFDDARRVLESVGSSLRHEHFAAQAAELERRIELVAAAEEEANEVREQFAKQMAEVAAEVEAGHYARAIELGLPRLDRTEAVLAPLVRQLRSQLTHAQDVLRERARWDGALADAENLASQQRFGEALEVTLSVLGSTGAPILAEQHARAKAQKESVEARRDEFIRNEAAAKKREELESRRRQYEASVAAARIRLFAGAMSLAAVVADRDDAVADLRREARRVIAVKRARIVLATLLLSSAVAGTFVARRVLGLAGLEDAAPAHVASASTIVDPPRRQRGALAAPVAPPPPAPTPPPALDEHCDKRWDLRGQSLTVASPEARLRPGANDTYEPVIATLHRGDLVVVDWYCTSPEGNPWLVAAPAAGGPRGYVSAKLLVGAQDAAPFPVGVVSVDELNVRGGPAVETESLTKLTRGSVVTLEGYRVGAKDTGWYQVTVDGRTGFVHVGGVRLLARSS